MLTVFFYREKGGCFNGFNYKFVTDDYYYRVNVLYADPSESKAT